MMSSSGSYEQVGGLGIRGDSSSGVCASQQLTDRSFPGPPEYPRYITHSPQWLTPNVLVWLVSDGDRIAFQR